MGTLSVFLPQNIKTIKKEIIQQQDYALQVSVDIISYNIHRFFRQIELKNGYALPNKFLYSSSL